MAIGTKARGFKAWLCISILKIETSPQSAKNPTDLLHYTVLVPALSRQGSISCHRSCGCLQDKHSFFLRTARVVSLGYCTEHRHCFTKTEVSHVGPSLSSPVH